MDGELMKLDAQSTVKQEPNNDPTMSFVMEGIKTEEEFFEVEGAETEIQESCSQVNFESIELKEEPSEIEGEECRSLSSKSTLVLDPLATYKRPKRKCVFCNKYVTQLRRHQTVRHANNKEILEIERLPRFERDKFYRLLKKKGILSECQEPTKKSTRSKITTPGKNIEDLEDQLGLGRARKYGKTYPSKRQKMTAKAKNKFVAQSKVKPESTDASTWTGSMTDLSKDPMSFVMEGNEAEEEFFEDKVAEIQASFSQVQFESIQLNEPLEIEEKDCESLKGEPILDSDPLASYKRPKRKCVFCNKNVTQLRRHQTNKHANEKEIQEIEKLPSEEKDKFYELLKKRGTLSESLERVKKATLSKSVAPCKIIGERGLHTTLKICPVCMGGFSPRAFSTHYKRCKIRFDQPVTSPPLKLNISKGYLIPCKKRSYIKKSAL